MTSFNPLDVVVNLPKFLLVLAVIAGVFCHFKVSSPQYVSCPLHKLTSAGQDKLWHTCAWKANQSFVLLQSWFSRSIPYFKIKPYRVSHIKPKSLPGKSDTYNKNDLNKVSKIEKLTSCTHVAIKTPSCDQMLWITSPLLSPVHGLSLSEHIH
jgi:hypothetical protein